MSEEKPIGLTIAEKFFGLIVILIGALTVNFTYNDPPEGIAAPFSPIFIAAGFVLIAIGIFLMLAKTE
jgi:hypothetical protein